MKHSNHPSLGSLNCLCGQLNYDGLQVLTIYNWFGFTLGLLNLKKALQPIVMGDFKCNFIKTYFCVE